jgi:hypothetical protein
MTLLDGSPLLDWEQAYERLERRRQLHEAAERTWSAGHPVILHTRRELDRALSSYEAAMDNLSSK